MPYFLDCGYTIREKVDYRGCYLWIFICKYHTFCKNNKIPKDIVKMISKLCIKIFPAKYVPGERDRF